LGTAFSFVHLLDFLAESNLRFQLPGQFPVMETGGYKNRSRALPRRIARAHHRTPRCPAPNIICEYGMSELSSQAYDGVTSDGWQVAAAWHLSVTRHSSSVTFAFPLARAQIISPETGREVATAKPA